jgi:hypothetical protein
MFLRRFVRHSLNQRKFLSEVRNNFKNRTENKVFAVSSIPCLHLCFVLGYHELFWLLGSQNINAKKYTSISV